MAIRRPRAGDRLRHLQLDSPGGISRRFGMDGSPADYLTPHMRLLLALLALLTGLSFPDVALATSRMEVADRASGGVATPAAPRARCAGPGGPRASVRRCSARCCACPGGAGADLRHPAFGSRARIGRAFSDPLSPTRRRASTPRARGHISKFRKNPCSALAKAIFGSSNDRYVKSLDKIVRKIAAFEPQVQAMSDEELKAQTAKFREQLDQGNRSTTSCPKPSPPCARRRSARWACAISTCR
jgi:hypothetical protein